MLPRRDYKARFGFMTKTEEKKKQETKAEVPHTKRLQIKRRVSSLALQQLIEEGGFFFQIRVSHRGEKNLLSSPAWS